MPGHCSPSSQAERYTDSEQSWRWHDRSFLEAAFLANDRLQFALSVTPYSWTRLGWFIDCVPFCTRGDLSSCTVSHQGPLNTWSLHDGPLHALCSVLHFPAPLCHVESWRSRHRDT